MSLPITLHSGTRVLLMQADLDDIRVFPVAVRHVSTAAPGSYGLGLGCTASPGRRASK